MTKLAEKIAAESAVAKGKAGKQSASEKFEAAEKMEGKAERVKSELAKAYERAEVAAAESFRENYLPKVQEMIAECIENALKSEAEKMTSREMTKEAAVLTQVVTEGKAESKGFTIRFSDTEKGMTEEPAEDLHTMFAAAKQSMLKVKIAERERKAAEAAAEQARKEAVMLELGVTAEVLAKLKEAGVIK